MKNVIFLTFAILFLGCGVHPIAQENRVKVQFYSSPQDFHERKLSSQDVFTEVRYRSKNHIRIFKYYDAKTLKRLKENNSPWAIRYKNTDYFNMEYCTPRAFRTYFKFDIVGDYCVIFVDKKQSQIIFPNNNYYFGGGLLGALGTEVARRINQKGKKWQKKEYGDVQFILVIDTKKIVTGNVAYAVILSEKNFNELLHTSYSKEKISRLAIDDVVIIIDDLNNQ